MRTITIATRNSRLAVWQAEWVGQQLQRMYPDCTIAYLPMTTDGDRFLSDSLAKIGGKGLFIKALETALIEGKADIAVHSMKDMPAKEPAGLQTLAIPERASPLDVMVSQMPFNRLPSGARVGTSSLRRQVQLQAIRQDLEWHPVRGNLDTRMAKLDAGEVDALILAEAGLRRLDYEQRITQTFTAEQLLPAIGQGALAIQARSDDESLRTLLAPLHHPKTALCVQAERSLSAALGGGCATPLAGFATLKGNKLLLRAVLGDGRGALISASASGGPSDPELLGVQVAEDLVAQGAEAMLETARQLHG